MKLSRLIIVFGIATMITLSCQQAPPEGTAESASIADIYTQVSSDAPSKEYCFAGPRVFMNDTDEDRAAIQPLVNQISAYPLTEFDGEMKIKDWNDVPSFPAPEVEGENKWVVPEAFFDQLSGVMDAVPLMTFSAFISAATGEKRQFLMDRGCRP